MKRTVDLGFLAGNDRDCARFDGGGDEVFGVEIRALERAEHCAGRNLAVIDGEARHGDVAGLDAFDTGALHQARELHSAVSASDVSSSSFSTR